MFTMVDLLGVTFQINPIPRQAAEGSNPVATGELIELATHGSVMYSVLALPKGTLGHPWRLKVAACLFHSVQDLQ